MIPALVPSIIAQAKDFRSRQPAKNRKADQLVGKRFFVHALPHPLEKIIFRNPAAAVDIAREYAVANVRHPRLVDDVSVRRVRCLD